MSTKKCYKCGLDKPYDSFYKDPNGKYGLSSKCKVCSSATFKEYWEKNKDYHRQVCNQDVTCEECLGTYKLSAKTSHYKTQKHQRKAEAIEKITSIEGIKEKS